MLVAYFSWSGRTQHMAEHIVAVAGAGADLFEIKTVKKYPRDYRECVNEAKGEKARDERPALEGTLPNVAAYDRIVVGFPVWWWTCPMAVRTFLEALDLNGKTIYPFCTHGGTGSRESTVDVKKSAVGADVRPCFDANFVDDGDIKRWLEL